MRCGLAPREPLSGQRRLTSRARTAVFPVAMGFGVETRMTIDAVGAGLEVEEVELPLEHRATGRDVRGFAHRGRQLADLVLACGPQAVNHRGLRLPLVGALVGVAVPAVAPVAAIGLADDLWSGPERGFRAHLGAGATTGTLKLVGIPLYALVRTRSLSGALLVGLTANAVNQLDTRPGRALKAFGLGALLLGGRAPPGRRGGRPDRPLRSEGDGDARRCRLERARRRARFLFRGATHGTEAVGCDRSALASDPRRRAPLARRR